MAIFEHPEFAGHERVIHVADEATGLNAIIAIHDRTLGPAVGGCRVFPYRSENEALTDVLRLSRGMTYKSALAALPFGGGKSVIIADPSQKSPALIAAFGRAINELSGQYWAGEDVNFGPADIETLAETTRFVGGRTKGPVTSGDPSPFTALGVLSAMKGALRHKFGRDAFDGRRVAIQGAGNVGYHLAKAIIDEGGSVTVSDISSKSLQRAEELGAAIVDADAIYHQECDVFAPCAMGATISEQSIPRLQARIVCGAANNQLATTEAGQALLDRDIAYVPDYLANSGGIINSSGEFHGHYDVAEVLPKIRALAETAQHILDRSQRERIPANLIADRMAEQILLKAKDGYP